MQQGCTLEVRLSTTLYCVKCGNYATCIEWSIVDYGTVHPSLTLFKLRSSFLSLANIYMEHYKEQLTTYVFSSTVEPSNIMHFAQQYSRIHKIHNSIYISNQRYSWSCIHIFNSTVESNNTLNTLTQFQLGINVWHLSITIQGEWKSW